MAASEKAPASPKSGTARMPVIFAAHGAPILLDDAPWMGELAAWAQRDAASRRRS